MTLEEIKIMKRGVVYILKLDSKDSINFTLRMPIELRLELERIAKKEDRTVTNLINMALKRYINMYNGEKNRAAKLIATL
jgi:hypothetical protein